jgi:hypothetical protein
MRDEVDFPVGRGLLMLAAVGGLVWLIWSMGAPNWAVILGLMLGFLWMRLEVLTWRLEG